MASNAMRGASGGTAPQSVENITRIAQNYEYNASVPLKYWLRTAATLLREARIYEREGHDEQAYLILFRHAQLILVHLSKHPDTKKNDEDRKALVAAEKEVEKNLSKLEVLRPRINKRYERYTQLMRERESRKHPSQAKIIAEPRDQVPDPALAGVAEPLEAGENRDLAVQLAQSELNRRATVRGSKGLSGPSIEGLESRRAAGVWGDGEHTKPDSRMGDQDLSQRIQNIRSNIDHTRQAYGQGTKVSELPLSDMSAYKYPTVPRQRALEPTVSPGHIAILDKNAERHAPPILPPKEHLMPSRASIIDSSAIAMAPSLPAKISPTPAVPEKMQVPKETTPTRSDLDPSSYTFKPSAYLENGTPLRSVFLPANLRSRFLSLASPNTRANLETCGILCGTLVSNALFISKLVIPEQTSTSDTCETVNESALFDYCDSEDLMTLGWIHTHPSQTCFMSSRDLHTHCGYQVMLPESIAIVCAPSKTPDWGVFRLTDPPGLKTVLNCSQTGLFHPHAEENIYTGALRPGHVVEVSGLEFDTVDLRPDA
ncbi:JAB1/Mov34/MPN/PAD-1 [Penicillium paradoxum]|uniref:JAB1/Mov34/MPN/PAD-1 n=1 Tax=Penicillium paradoxum TaxID=176176 RepID=UPI0025495FE0|nr:JAB1/Mov34/MPN/PAD-1 [Penicillium paradoxum]KAJ5780532.1 JAB1/Mov34/MPN/PAD-1 [Penicillium paradoxum]